MQQPMQNPKDSSDPTAAMNMTLALLAKAFKVNTIPINNNQRSSLIPRNSLIAQPGMNTSQDIKMQMVDDNVGNQVRHNAVQNDGNEVGKNAVQNSGIQIVKNINGLSVVSEIANQYVNGNVVTATAEGNGNGINGNPIRCYNCRGEGHYASNCIVKSRKRDAAYLQQQLQIAQEEETGIQSTQKEFEFMIAADAHEETEIVKVNCTSEDTLQQAFTYGAQSDNAPVYDSDGSAEVHHYDNCYNNDIFNMLTQEVQYTDLQTGLNRTKQKLESCIIKNKKEYATLWNNWYKKCKECKYDKIPYDKAYNDMQTKIERLQAQLGDLKAKCPVIDKVSEPKGTTKGTRTNTMFTKQSILGKPPSFSYKPKSYSVTPFPKSSVLPKVDKTNALSKPVTLNSAPVIRESKVMKIINVIALRIFRTDSSKTSRIDNVVPNKPIKISVMIKPITVSQPNVIHKHQANSDLNGFSSTKVNNIAKTRRPHPRGNSNTDMVPSKSKSSYMNSRADNQSANVSIHENQKKHKANAKKSKELGSKGSLASSRPSKPRTYLTWIPIGIIVSMCAKLTASSNTKSKFKKSVYDNASTSNPSKPSSKGFLNSASLLGRLSRLKKQHTSIYPIAVF
nr:hypothetical protein [Tanacetum cinerariifolium]